MSPEENRDQMTGDESDEPVAPAPEEAREKSEVLTEDELEDAAGGATLLLQQNSAQATLGSAARIEPTKLRKPLRSRTTRRGANELGFDPGRGP